MDPLKVEVERIARRVCREEAERQERMKKERSNRGWTPPGHRKLTEKEREEVLNFELI